MGKNKQKTKQKPVIIGKHDEPEPEYYLSLKKIPADEGKLRGADKPVSTNMINLAKTLINSVDDYTKVCGNLQDTIWKIGKEDGGLRIDNQGPMSRQNKDMVNVQLQTNIHPRNLSVTLAEVHVPKNKPEDNTIKTLDFKRALVMSLEDRVKVVMVIGTDPATEVGSTKQNTTKEKTLLRLKLPRMISIIMSTCLYTPSFTGNQFNGDF